jgi:hypothetical protein
VSPETNHTTPSDPRVASTRRSPGSIASPAATAGEAGTSTPTMTAATAHFAIPSCPSPPSNPAEAYPVAMHDDLATRVHDLFPSLTTMLADLVRIPSVSLTGYPPGEVRRSAEHLVGVLGEAGFSNVQPAGTRRCAPGRVRGDRGPGRRPHRAVVRPPRRPAPGSGRGVAHRPLRPVHRGRTHVRTRSQRRQGRHRHAPGGGGCVRRRPAGRREAVHRRRGGSRFGASRANSSTATRPCWPPTSS